jgi:hypothetical protein
LFDLYSKGRSGRYLTLLPFRQQYACDTGSGPNGPAQDRAFPATGYPTEHRPDCAATSNKDRRALVSFGRYSTLIVDPAARLWIIRSQYSHQTNTSSVGKDYAIKIDPYRTGSVHPFGRSHLGDSALDNGARRYYSAAIGINRHCYRGREFVADVRCPGTEGAVHLNAYDRIRS